jgi:hypothetical protein
VYIGTKKKAAGVVTTERPKPQGKEGFPMATPSVAHEWQYTPLDTPRRCRNELAQLTLEIRRQEHVDAHTATRMAIQVMHELEEYRDEGDRMAYLAGNTRSGLPF